MSYDVKSVVSHFGVDGECELFGNGHINDTYFVHSTPPCILQKVNTNTFKEPVKVIEKLVGMDLPDEQVEKVIDAIKAKLKVDDLGDVLGVVGKLFK